MSSETKGCMLVSDAVIFRHRISSDSTVKDPTLDPSPGILWDFIGFIKILIISDRIPSGIRWDPTIGMILLGTSRTSFDKNE